MTTVRPLDVTQLIAGIRTVTHYICIHLKLECLNILQSKISTVWSNCPQTADNSYSCAGLRPKTPTFLFKTRAALSQKWDSNADNVV